MYEKSESVVNFLGAHGVIRVIREDWIPSSMHCIEALQKLQEWLVCPSLDGWDGREPSSGVSLRGY